MAASRCDTVPMNIEDADMPWTTRNRDIIQVDGPDAATYLQSQLSQDIRPLQIGESMWTFVLQPTGKVEVFARISRLADQTFRLDTDRGFGQLLMDRLNRFKIRVKADLALIVAEDQVDVDVDVDQQLELARINAGWPRMGAEITAGESIPAETGVIGQAVSFTKGCYPGQELVERMDSRGSSAPRQLRTVDVPLGARPGDPLLIEGRDAGVVTSVVGTRALALVKRSALQD